MVSQRAQVSLVGQAIGWIVGTAIFMFGFDLLLIPAALSGLVFLLLGGWLAEKYLSDETVETRAAGG